MEEIKLVGYKGKRNMEIKIARDIFLNNYPPTCENTVLTWIISEITSG